MTEHQCQVPHLRPERIVFSTWECGHCEYVWEFFNGQWRKTAIKDPMSSTYSVYEELCGPDCSLHFVRPGKTQCNEDGKLCPNKRSDNV